MKKLLLLAAFLLLNLISISQTVPVTIINGTLKACDTNIVTATFTGIGQHKLKIKGALNFGNNTHVACGNSNGVLIEILSLKDSANLNPISFSPPVTDTANGSVFISFITLDTVILTYRIHIDCSAIPTGANVDPIFVKQTWTDSISGVNYDLNAFGVDTLQSAAILYPKLVYVPTVIDTIGYQESRILQFTFLNSGFTTANISFRFLEDATNYCGAFVNVDSLLFYKIRENGTPVNYISGDQAFIQLPVSDTLFIYKRIQAVNCLDTCTHHAIFTWQCANRDSLGTAFCSSCFGSDTINYVIQNRIMPQLKVIRAVPVSDQVTNFDVSCPNSLTGMRQWEYFITTDDIGKLDSAVIHFTNYHSDVISSLGLIPENTLQIDTLCSNCNFQMTYGQRDFALCADSVTNPIDNLKMIITNFGDGDTIKFRFQSFRCVEEDTLLYNVPKSYTNWTFRNTYSVSKCGLKDSLDFLYPAYTADGIVDQVAAVADLSLIYTPTVSDLSSPPNNFGDSADFEIKMNGLFIDEYDIVQQLIGCDASNTNCIPTGYFKVTIECEKGLIVPNAQNYTRIKYKDSLGFINYYEPEYFYQDTSILGQCAAGSYVYYFNLNDSNTLRMIKGGYFQFRLRSCCGGQNGAVKYKVLYDWLLNPSGSCNSLSFPVGNANPAICTGTNCKWLPLSFVEDDIVVHCPGCITPGIVVRSYRMERSSYGNKDSNDNGFADSPLTPIEYNSPSFLANRNDYGWYNSGIGDQLTDYLIAEFGAGDSGAGGYTYPMMQFQHSYLNHLQLDRIISAGLDTMKVLPDTVLLYIDTPVSGAPDSCIDCGVFNVDSAKFVTQRVLKFFGSSLSKILFLDAVNNRYYFSFSSVDSSGHTGVLNGSDIIYNNTTYPYLGFFERQQYRLSVDYNVTGNFNLPRNYSGAVALDLIRKQSDIENRMWLSGDSLPSFAWNQSVKNPANIVELDSAGWYFPPDTTIGDTAVNQNFANQYMFNCENLDGIHYFYAHIYDVKSEASYVDDCTFKIQTSIFTNVAARILDPYPFEYHPSNIQPRSYTFTIPSGYSTVGALLTNEIYGGGVSYRNQTASLTIDTNTTFTYFDNSFQIDPCLTEGETTTGTKLYFGDIQTFKSIEILIASNNCDTSGFKIDSTTAVVSFEGDVDHCVDVNAVTFDFVDTLKSLQGTILYHIRPNDKVSFTPNFDVQSNRICFVFSINNPFITFADSTYSTFAPNYFVVIPDTTTLNWLSNWTYHSSYGISYPINNQFFLSDTLLAINETHNGDSICASFSSCPDSASQTIKFYTGWSCSDSLVQPFDTTALCQFDSITYLIELESTNLGLSDGGARNRPLSEVYYTLCDTLFYECCFKSTQNGEVTLSNIELPNFPDSLGVLDVSIRKGYCDSSSTEPWHSIIYDSLQNYWPIFALDMDAIGYIDSVLKITEGISVRIAYMPDCHFGDTLPDVVLNANSYCNDPISSTYPFSNTLSWDGESKCYDCFEITKSLSSYNDTIRTGDTITYNITIYANNADSVPVILTDSLPAGFVVTSSIPNFITMPGSDSITFQLQGYFTITGTCPDLQNEVFLQYTDYDVNNNPTSNLITVSDTACLEVISKCITSSTIIFKANDYSSNGYSSSYVNKHIYLEGDFYVDMNMSFDNCIIKTKAGSQIILLGNNTMTFFNTIISACDTLWKGIHVVDRGTVYLENLNSIQDAHQGVNLGLNGNLVMIKSEIINSVTGVLIPPAHPNYFGGSVDIRESVFGMYSNSFLPNYQGQPTHGIISYAGIDISDASLSIGDDLTGTNIFHNMNIGIRGFRSNLDVFNCAFDSIRASSYYNTKGNASAVVAVGDTALSIPSSITVHPMPTSQDNMIHCQTGVYSFYSDLTVNANLMKQMRDGIAVYHCKNGLTTHIQANQIEATHYGITLIDNATGGGIYVEDNQITIDGFKGGVGIMIKELIFGSNINYQINANQIELVNGLAGIQTTNIKDASITYNYVHLSEGAGTAPNSTGIELTATTRTTVNCNTVIGFTDVDAKTKGFVTSQSPSNTINCNTADTVGYGYFFGGAMCTNTIFQGNYMGISYTGLYLNSEATIGKQPSTQSPPYHGNIWLDTTRYYSGFGAVNMNDSTPLSIAGSLFTTNQNMSSHNPKIPIDIGVGPFFVDDNGWFAPQISGSSFNCSTNWTCATFIVGDGEDEYRSMVVNDSTVSSVFIPESKVMAQQLIFKELKEDSVLLNSEVNYQSFANEKENEAIGRLYSANMQLNKVGMGESALLSTISLASQIVNITSDSIRYIDSLLQISPTTNLLIQKEDLIEIITGQREILSNTGNQIKSNDLISLSNATIVNNNADPSQLPDANEKFMNAITIGYKISGLSFLLNNYESILHVAIQCPYSGGAAVSTARTFVYLLNDTMEYGDDAICGAMGIFRLQNTKEKIAANQITMFPNPSTGVVQLVFEGLDGDKINVEVFDVLGKLIFTKNMLTNSNTISLTFNNFNNGLYNVKLFDQLGNHVTGKILLNK